ncbi:MAG: UDP-N-acetylmuramate dehydrogenase [Candidatus Roizmanbacteria bacterium]|nr:UDP-N-acetylmuramate dehydrogenase [Candidatus Roizmanbacteria bacterium]
MNKDQKGALSKMVDTGRIIYNTPLAPLTSIKIGGSADALIYAHSEHEIAQVVGYAKNEQIPLYILGGGSNIVFSDEGYRGIVLKLTAGKELVERDTRTCRITFSSGYISHLASVRAVQNGCGGFEGMYGLPGTIGGALYMNSKWPAGHFTTADRLVSILYMAEDGITTTLTKEELMFSYGFSMLQNRSGIVLSATFEFELEDPKNIQHKCDLVMNYRQTTQPIGVHTAGCVFKNISLEEMEHAHLPTRSAGYFIDKCGLKGERKNGLVISDIHANFFINESGATAKDFIYLKEKVKDRVYKKFNVLLREEVLVV